MKLRPSTIAALAKILTAIGVDAGPCFRAAFDAAAPKAGERAALRAGWRALESAFERTAAGWVKRETPTDVAEVAAPVIACPSCSRAQPEFACTSCGTAGPGIFCCYCRGDVRTGKCPKCGADWDPSMVAQDDTDDDAAKKKADAAKYGEGRGMVIVPLGELEVRAVSKSEGEIIGWANSDRFDAHESYIMPDEILPLIGRDLTQIDEEHNMRAVSGVVITERWMGKRAVLDPETKKSVQACGVGVKLRFDLTQPGARAAYESYDRGMKSPADRTCYRGLSIGFYAPKVALDAWRSGTTKTITPITSVPWLSMVRAPSNSAADVMELRSLAALTRAPAPTKPDATKKAADADLPAKVPEQTTLSTQVESVDILSQVRQGLDEADGKTSKAAAPADPPDAKAGIVQPPAATPSQPEARTPAATADPFAEINSRVEAHSSAIDELRARPQSRDWESEVKALEAENAALRASLQLLEARAATSEAHTDQIVKALPVLIKEREMRVMAWVERKIEELVAPERRIGNPGDLDEIRAAEGFRALKADADRDSEVNWAVSASRLLARPA